MTSLQTRAGSKDGRGGASRAAKRLLDLIGAGASLVALAPVLGVVAASLRVESPHPVLVRQRRVGQGGREFDTYRFRTTDGGRQTPLGAFLCGTGLAALPQLIDVLRGEVSLVGPRALSVAESDQLRQDDPVAYLRRATVPPGVTGPCQLAEPYAADPRSLLECELEYVERWSLGLDLLLLCRLFATLVRGRGTR